VDDVKATYTDGILEVRIPVDAAEAEATKLPSRRSSHPEDGSHGGG
jgi:hypothetical protein